VIHVPWVALTSFSTDRKLDVAAEKGRLKCSFTGTVPDLKMYDLERKMC